MATETTFSPRQQLLVALSNDLEAQGWNQRPKLWLVKGESADEWLEFAAEITSAPQDHLTQRIIDEDLPVEAHGILLSSEGWEYPREVASSFKTEAQRRAYWQATPPSKHPARVEVRQLLLVCNDGEVLAMAVTHEPNPVITWASVDHTVPSPVGDDTVDLARAVLGVNEPLRRQVMQVKVLRAMSRILEILGQAMDGQLSEEDVAREVFLVLPEGQRAEMIQTLPEELKELLRRGLSQDDQTRYGL